MIERWLLCCGQDAVVLEQLIPCSDHHTFSAHKLALIKQHLGCRLQLSFLCTYDDCRQVGACKWALYRNLDSPLVNLAGWCCMWSSLAAYAASQSVCKTECKCTVQLWDQEFDDCTSNYASFAWIADLLSSLLFPTRSILLFVVDLTRMPLTHWIVSLLSCLMNLRA